MRIVINGLKANFESHLEHIPGALTNWVLSELRFLPGDQFVIKDLEIPEGPLPTRNLVGPTCGDEPVKESEVYYAVRSGAKDRTWKSRLIDRDPPQTRWVRVVCVPVALALKDGVVGQEVLPTDEGDILVYLLLATAYGIGQKGESQAPPEPEDPDIQPGGRLWGTGLLEKSQAFWAVHALCQSKDR